ncbi:hypothetical protein TSUD_358600 [Trifolium subterraneum]|uniref:Subtilisin-like protease fibronectin type-III domain-containing protein n=1 Tax=Trifolium subterraneum TaxID=3900 RepID=A0A2Z6MT89_TRISU|nr:hypothetical protein TSUD_358600 [Trifolium subterraneum]
MSSSSSPSPHSLLLLLFFTFFLFSLSHSQQSNTPQTFIIHVSKSPKSSLFSTNQNHFSSILNTLPSSSSSTPPSILYTYTSAIHGFSAHLTPSQADHLKSHPDILSIQPDQIRHLHTTHTPSFLGLAETSGLWPNSHFASDVIIGVLDTGIWPELHSFSDPSLSKSTLPSSWKDSSKVKGKIVVCDRGGNARVEKGSAVKKAGGLGMIMSNTEENGEELLADAHLIAATMVGQTAGDKIKEYIKSSENPTATIKFKGTVIGGSDSPSAPQVASFSSRGPNYRTSEILKPDVIAPGVNILAGWTGKVGPTDLEIDPRRVEFNIISGTSMSCPHVSGIAALLRKAFPKFSPAAIKSALMTTAYNVDNSGGKIKDLGTGKESNPFVHGAGHVDPNKALNPGLVYDINTNDYLSFLCSIGYDAKKIQVFTREPTSYNICENEGNFDSPGDLNYPSFSVEFGAYNSLVKYKRVVTNVGGSDDAVYTVKIDAPFGVDVNVSPSKLVFSSENKTQAFEITFTRIGYGGSQSFGSIEWSDGSHIVRSPIAVRWSNGFSSASY